MVQKITKKKKKNKRGKAIKLTGKYCIRWEDYSELKNEKFKILILHIKQK
jgi:hypothetical protein